MTYHLRNPHKIIEHYGVDYLQRMYDALDHHFKMNMIIRYDVKEVDEFDPYPQIFVRDLGHTVNDFVFYVVKVEGYNYRLAFKEVIG